MISAKRAREISDNSEFEFLTETQINYLIVLADNWLEKKLKSIQNIAMTGSKNTQLHFGYVNLFYIFCLALIWRVNYERILRRFYYCLESMVETLGYSPHPIIEGRNYNLLKHKHIGIKLYW